MSGEFAGYGFAAGDVRGTRSWRVDTLGRLTGVVHQKVWRPGENVAECLRMGAKTNAAPVQVAVEVEAQEDTATRCSCGSPSCNRYTKNKSGNGHRPQKVQAKAAARTGTRVVTAGSGLRVGWSAGSFSLGLVQPTEPNPCDGMDPDCACGFYAYQEGSNDYYKPDSDEGRYGTMTMWVSNGTVTTGNAAGVVGGVVRGYGRTVLGTRGFRSEKAEILALYVEKRDPKRVAMKLRLEHLYKVPTFLDYEDMLKAFPPTPPESMGDPGQDDFWTRSAS